MCQWNGDDVNFKLFVINRNLVCLMVLDAVLVREEKDIF
jgi:hypothetical protein